MLEGLGVRRKENNIQLLTTKSLKKHSRICILMKMMVELTMLVAETNT